MCCLFSNHFPMVSGAAQDVLPEMGCHFEWALHLRARGAKELFVPGKNQRICQQTGKFCFFFWSKTGLLIGICWRFLEQDNVFLVQRFKQMRNGLDKTYWAGNVWKSFWFEHIWTSKAGCVNKIEVYGCPIFSYAYDWWLLDGPWSFPWWKTIHFMALWPSWQGLGLMSQHLYGFVSHHRNTNICWKWNIPNKSWGVTKISVGSEISPINRWVMWSIGTFTNPCLIFMMCPMSTRMFHQYDVPHRCGNVVVSERTIYKRAPGFVSFSMTGHQHWLQP